MRVALISLGLILAPLVNAAEPTTWTFVYVVRSTELWVRDGDGTLTLDRGKLTGKFVGDGDVEFYFNGKLKNGKVSAHFGAVESDDGGTFLSGTFRQVAIPGSNSCWQTMQLSDGFSSLALARNAPLCEP